MAKTNGVKTIVSQPNPDFAKKKHGVVKILKVLLADESVLYTKLRNYHWNVTGASFYSLRAAFESQFIDIGDIVDVVAERIRQYGTHAPGTMAEFIRKAHLVEAPGVYPDARTMAANLVTDHETIIHFLHECIEAIGTPSVDVGVIDLLTRLSQQHEKMAWMMRMWLEDQTAPSD